ncbi:phage tail protein [Sphingobium abikonense]|uniref:phage tail protein n=1 Tax=Sphingobium abikonense TaxID=86193 RepID=UPI000786C133|nr:phage tail protein [Sphingobium abikonense]
MLKLDSLRKAIATALPEMARSPEHLRIWIERGAGRCQGTTSDAFGFTFQANVLIVEMTSEIAVLAHAIFRWLRVNQPDLLSPGREGFSFDADILDNGSADVLLQLQLTQNVTVAPKDGGGFALAYLAEPDPLFTDDQPIDGIAPAPPFAGVDIDYPG